MSCTFCQGERFVSTNDLVTERLLNDNQHVFDNESLERLCMYIEHWHIGFNPQGSLPLWGAGELLSVGEEFE